MLEHQRAFATPSSGVGRAHPSGSRNKGLRMPLAAARDAKASRLDALLAEALVAGAERAAMSQTRSYDADSLQSDYGVCFAQAQAAWSEAKATPGTSPAMTIGPRL